MEVAAPTLAILARGSDSLKEGYSSRNAWSYRVCSMRAVSRIVAARICRTDYILAKMLFFNILCTVYDKMYNMQINNTSLS